MKAGNGWGGRHANPCLPLSFPQVHGRNRALKPSVGPKCKCNPPPPPLRKELLLMLMPLHPLLLLSRPPPLTHQQGVPVDGGDACRGRAARRGLGVGLFQDVLRHAWQWQWQARMHGNLDVCGCAVTKARMVVMRCMQHACAFCTPQRAHACSMGPHVAPTHARTHLRRELRLRS